MIGDFCETINVRFTGTKIAAFDRVVEQPINAVPVILIILCRVDAALRGNGMRTPRGVLKTKTFHPIPELAECCRGRSAGQTSADHNHFELSPIIRVDQSDMVPVISPFLSQQTRRNFWIECSNHAPNRLWNDEISTFPQYQLRL